MQDLAETIENMIDKGKGILAIDESFPTIKKRFVSIGVESTEANRRAYRELLITNTGSNKYISGIILFDETIRQSTKDGTAFPVALHNQNIMTGIKVDTGAKDLAAHAGEKVTEGLDGLRDRLAEYKKLGARFAKWRAVITIGEAIPSRACIAANVHALARYAALCQEAGIVPMVEPEVLMDGTHDIQRCYTETKRTLTALFKELEQQEVVLEHIILKVNMVVSGKDCSQKASAEEVAKQTVDCLLETVPKSVPGIFFLSGGQSAKHATIHLDIMNKNYAASLPWVLSFSYGRALQAPCLESWQGKAENVATAQAILLHREKCNGLASLGQYSTEHD